MEENSLRIAWVYRCANCGEQFSWCYYDLLRLTDSPTMPCGCRWIFLTMA
jgi:DNA-directed RNA polymerase subunit RPC12/RpoP